MGLPGRHPRRARGRCGRRLRARGLAPRAADGAARRTPRPRLGAAVDRRPLRAPGRRRRRRPRAGGAHAAGLARGHRRRDPRRLRRHRRALRRRRRALPRGARRRAQQLRPQGLALPEGPLRPALGHRPRRQPVGRAQAAHRALGLGGGAVAGGRPGAARASARRPRHARGFRAAARRCCPSTTWPPSWRGWTGCCGSASTRTRAPAGPRCRGRRCDARSLGDRVLP